MKYIVLLITTSIFISLQSQRISNIFLDAGMNHSGFITRQPNTKTINDFKENYNPMAFIALGLELRLKDNLSLMTGIGIRRTGTEYLIPYGTSRFATLHKYLKQVTFPLMLNYSFGKKFQFKPLLGVVNIFNYSNYDLRAYIIPLNNINKYAVNGLIGLMFCNNNLFGQRFGLGVKLAYERNLMDIDNTPSTKINQAIVSGSLMLIYNFKGKRN